MEFGKKEEGSPDERKVGNRLNGREPGVVEGKGKAGGWKGVIRRGGR